MKFSINRLVVLGERLCFSFFYLMWRKPCHEWIFECSLAHSLTYQVNMNNQNFLVIPDCDCPTQPCLPERKPCGEVSARWKTIGCFSEQILLFRILFTASVLNSFIYYSICAPLTTALTFFAIESAMIAMKLLSKWNC